MSDPHLAYCLSPVTEEQRARYKAAYRAYCLAGRTLLAARADWLPEPPANPVEDFKSGSQYMANHKLQQELIQEVHAELEAEEALHV